MGHSGGFGLRPLRASRATKAGEEAEEVTIVHHRECVHNGRQTCYHSGEASYGDHSIC
jgi:hypothetical protein